ncbi:MAG TPA: hypothetical protein VEY95_04220 [Azospirillaceae bacterium]|nr:hypothetical protein [Azospirillaceae bacterium]
MTLPYKTMLRNLLPLGAAAALAACAGARPEMTATSAAVPTVPSAELLRARGDLDADLSLPCQANVNLLWVSTSVWDRSPSLLGRVLRRGPSLNDEARASHEACLNSLLVSRVAWGISEPLRPLEPQVRPEELEQLRRQPGS